MNNQTNKNESGINLLDLFMYLASKWKWFLLSVLIFGGLAWLKYAHTPFVYFRQATVIIKDPSNKTSSAGLDRYEASDSSRTEDTQFNVVRIGDELTEILKQYKTLHNTTDVDTAKRAIRAIEIQQYYAEHPDEVKEKTTTPLHSLIIGVDIDREARREKISRRLKARLDEGMIAEVKVLLDRGIAPEDLIYYGLEYKFVTNFLIGNISYDEMVSTLEIAIHQFAKRQMTGFRGMERRGIHIEWIDYAMQTEEKIQFVKDKLKEIG